MFCESLLLQTSYLPTAHETLLKARHSPHMSSKTSLLFPPAPKLWIFPVRPSLQAESTGLLFQAKALPAYTKIHLQILPAALVSNSEKGARILPLPPAESRCLKSSVPTSPVFLRSMQEPSGSETTPHSETDCPLYRKESLSASFPQKSALLCKAIQ